MGKMSKAEMAKVRYEENLAKIEATKASMRELRSKFDEESAKKARKDKECWDVLEPLDEKLRQGRELTESERTTRRELMAQLSRIQSERSKWEWDHADIKRGRQENLNQLEARTRVLALAAKTDTEMHEAIERARKSVIWQRDSLAHSYEIIEAIKAKLAEAHEMDAAQANLEAMIATARKECEDLKANAFIQGTQPDPKRLPIAQKELAALEAELARGIGDGARAAIPKLEAQLADSEGSIEAEKAKIESAKDDLLRLHRNQAIRELEDRVDALCDPLLTLAATDRTFEYVIHDALWNRGLRILDINQKLWKPGWLMHPRERSADEEEAIAERRRQILDVDGDANEL